MLDDLKSELLSALPPLGEVLTTRQILFGDVFPVIGKTCADLQLENVLLLADENTYPLCQGHSGMDGFIAERYILPAGVKPGMKVVDALVEYIASSGVGAVLALGSGTINDIAKYASFLCNVPYVVIPTAPSMNGYISSNASIISGQFRTSVAAHLPVAVLCDEKILSLAPECLLISGIGDTLCRAVVQFDWLLSHYLSGGKYQSEVFELMLPYERELLAMSSLEDVRRNIKVLLMSLLAGGAAMLWCGGSYPASQGEHMWAHTMEMMGVDGGGYHGQEVAVTSWYSSILQQRLLEGGQAAPVGGLKQEDVESMLLPYFSSGLTKQCLVAYQEKLDALQGVRGGVELPQYLYSHVEGYSSIRAAYQKFGLPCSPEQIGWGWKSFKEALKIARFTRNRITFLDFYNEQEFLLDESTSRH